MRSFENMIFRLQAANWIANFIAVTIQPRMEVSPESCSDWNKEEKLRKIEDYAGLTHNRPKPHEFSITSSELCVYLHAFGNLLHLLGLTIVMGFGNLILSEKAKTPMLLLRWTKPTFWEVPARDANSEASESGILQLRRCLF